MSVENGVMMQYFQWYTPADGKHWQNLAADAQDLVEAGFTALWLPPASKGSGGAVDVGYGQYDLFDLGEFNQKGSVRTKYGTKDQLVDAIRAAQTAGLQIYADVVFNHKDGADETEQVWVQEVDWNDRNRALSDWYQIDAYTRFTFPGRAGKYSSMSWFWWCFDALSYNADTHNTSRLYRLKDKCFSTGVSHEHGNYDYLQANDLDMSSEFVRGELIYWGEWFMDQCGVDGFRLDACKHIRSSWFPYWLGHLRGKTGKELFSVGEYWSQDIDALHQFIYDTEGTFSLFDVPLHYNFSNASQCGNSYDMRTLLDGTLIKDQPSKAVTFVENHDTQPCQSLQSPVEPWFKPLAYAVILLRAEGYPCVSHADYYGAQYDNCLAGKPPVVLYSHKFLIDRFMKARREYGFGDQHDYFDHPNTIGWVRLGNQEHPGSMAVVMTNGSSGNKWMNIYRPGKLYRDVTGHITDTVITNGDGWGKFPCPAGNVSVWVQE
jgi:alpha-amylase